MRDCSIGGIQRLCCKTELKGGGGGVESNEKMLVVSGSYQYYQNNMAVTLEGWESVLGVTVSVDV